MLRTVHEHNTNGINLIDSMQPELLNGEQGRAMP